MQFAFMSGLWFALALPLIVMMYLMKRKYVDTPVSSHLLWNRTLQEFEANRPWQKLRTRLLMIIQLLAAGLLVLALMQPLWLGARPAAGHIVFVIDRSASMSAAAAAGGTRLEEAKRLVLGQLRETSGSAVTLLAVGGEPELLAARSTDADALRKAVEALEPYYGSAAYGETLSLAEALTRDEPDAEVRFVTDGQIPVPLGEIRFAAPFRVIKADAAGTGPTDPDSARPEPAAANAAVTQFGVRLDPGGSGTVTASASIRYWGEGPVQIGVTVKADGIRAAEKQVMLEPGRTAAVFFDGLPVAEWYRLEAETGDAYTADDAVHAFLAQDRPKQALVVSRGNVFLEKALRLAGAEVTLLAPEDAETWAQTALMKAGRADAPDVIVVDDAGAALPQDGAWPEALAQSPALLIRSGYEGEERGAPGGPYEAAEHPVNRYLSFSDVHVGAWLKPAEPFGTPIVTAKDGPLLIAGAQNGRPRLTLTFALHHSDWPLRAEFPVFVRNALEWLTEHRSGSLGRAVAGAELEIEFDALAAGARWVNAETGASQEVLPVDGRLPSGQRAPLIPGLYLLKDTDASGAELSSRWLDVVPDPGESSLAALHGDPGAAQPGIAAGEVGAPPAESEQLPAGREAGRTNGPSHVPLWRLAALLALAAIVWEWEVYRRGISV